MSGTLARDVLTLFLTRSSRSFALGWLSVVFPLHLVSLGLDEGGVGIAVSLTLFATAAANLAVRRPAERMGPAPVLIGLAALSAAAGALLLAAESPWLAVAAAMLGGAALGAGDSGASMAMEVVLLSRASRRETLTQTLSLYNVAGYGAAALGAAAAWRSEGHPDWAFAAYLACALLQAAAYATLPRRNRAAAPAGTLTGARPAHLRGTTALVRRMAALFALDAFAGGFVAQGIIVYWFHARFGLDAGALGALFSAVHLVTGFSFLLATPLSARFGLVPSMVFSHLVSNVLLIAVAFAPTFETAAALLLARHLLSQIDVPTRHTFLMLAVEDRAREDAASLTNLSRSFAQCLSPAATGLVMRAGSLAAPFLLGGGLKIIYDLLLYGVARGVDLEAGSKMVDASVASDDTPG